MLNNRFEHQFSNVIDFFFPVMIFFIFQCERHCSIMVLGQSWRTWKNGDWKFDMLNVDEFSCLPHLTEDHLYAISIMLQKVH